MEFPAGSDGPAAAAYQRLHDEIRDAVENGLGNLDILVLSQALSLQDLPL